MHPDLSKAFDLLGVKPGVSNRELKAAHRDLAKVWHPDRFLHDARLQEKAQEKLKEINEAYELLISGKVPNATPSRSAETVYSQPQRRRTNSSQWTAVPLLIFVAVFAVTITFLLQRRQPMPSPVEETRAATVTQEPAIQDQPDSRTRSIPKQNSEAAAPEVSSTEVATSVPAPALATVTVTIDPASGLLAKQDCPVRSRMTYPGGSQPTGYCNLDHTPSPKESKIKSLAKSVGRALD